jgi:hypothetical protein
LSAQPDRPDETRGATGLAVAPYVPPPSYPPPPQQRAGRTEARAIWSLLTAIIGLALGLVIGLPGLVLGPIAYFLGKSAISRIDSSTGELGGRGTAVAGWVMGVVAMAIGAVVTLVWFIVFLIAISGSSSG